MPLLDTLLTIGVVGGIIILIWAKVTKQTIPELIGGILDNFRDGGEEAKEEIEDRIGIYH